MKTASHCMPEACPEARSTFQLIQVEVHPCAAVAQTGSALGSDDRSYDSSLAKAKGTAHIRA